MGLITHLERESRSQVISPLHPRDPALAEFLGVASDNPAGVDVTHRSALGLTAYWAGVNIISSTIAMLPLQVFQHLPVGRRPAPDHVVNQLLHVRPNPLMSPYTFKQIRKVHELTWGNSYAEIERDVAGRAIALWPLPPDRVRVLRRGNEKIFMVRVEDGTEVVVSADRMLHVQGLGADGIRGYSIIAFHAASLGMSIATNEYGARFYANSAKPSGYLEIPGEPSPDTRKELRADWDHIHQGLSNVQRTALLWGGMKWQPMSLPPEDSQFLQTRAFQIEEMARILNVNPILLQHHEKATTWGSGIEQFMLAYRMLTTQPLCTRDEDEMNWMLFPPGERGEFFVKYNLDAMLRGDSLTRAQVNEIMRRNGVLNADEWRQQDERNPLPEGQGALYFMPLNMAPLDQLAAGPESTPPKPRRSLSLERRSLTVRQRHQRAHVKAFQDGARRFLRRDVEAAGKAVERAFSGGGDPLEALDAWIKDFYPGQQRVIVQVMLPIVSALGSVVALEAMDEVGGEMDQESLDVFADAYTEALAVRETSSSIGQIRSIIADPNLEGNEAIRAALDTRFGEWGELRADKVAMNEVVRVGNSFARRAWQVAGIAGLVWRASADACPLCIEMDGRRVSATGFFATPGETVEGEGVTALVVENNVAQPPLHQGCTCQVVPG